MTVSERRNYHVAILFSIILHLSLVLIIFPMQLLSIPAKVEEVAVGIYEFVDSEPEVMTSGPDPEITIKTDKPKPKPIPSPTKPVIQTNPKLKDGQPSQNSKPTENIPKVPISLGDGSGMVLGFGQKPSYPKNADNEGVEGEVLIRVLLRKDGTIEKVEFKKRSGDSRLDNAAKDSLTREWLFRPNTEDYFIEILFSFIDHEPDYKLINSATRP